MYRLKMLSPVYCAIAFSALFCLVALSGCSGGSTAKGSVAPSQNPPLNPAPAQNPPLNPDPPKNPGDATTWDEKLYGSEAQYWLEKTYCDLTFSDSEVANDTILIVLSKFATSKWDKKYTAEDFPEIDGKVYEITDLSVEIIKMQLEAQRTGDWSKLQKYVENSMLINIDTFRRILMVRLANPGVENVRNAIKLLEKRKDIISVGPDVIFYINRFPY